MQSGKVLFSGRDICLMQNMFLMESYLTCKFFQWMFFIYLENMVRCFEKNLHNQYSNCKKSRKKNLGN